jgi:hypothetical protein
MVVDSHRYRLSACRWLIRSTKADVGTAGIGASGHWKRLEISQVPRFVAWASGIN